MEFPICWFLLLLALVSSSESGKLKVIGNSTSSLHEAVTLVFREMFSREVITVNVIRAEGSQPAQDFLDGLLSTQTDASDIVFRLDTSYEVIAKRKKIFNVFPVQNMKQFQMIFTNVTPEKFRFNGFFVVVLIDGETSTMDEIFEQFWQKMIYNVIIIFECECGKVFIYTFLPFTSDRCNDVRPVWINSFENGKFTSGLETLFASNIDDMFNCPVRVAVADNREPFISITNSSDGTKLLDGQDIKLLAAVAESINFKIDITYLGRDGTFYGNGTSDGILELLLDNTADIALGHSWIKPSQMSFLGATNSFASEPQMLVIPPRRSWTPLQKLVIPFSTTVWMLILTIHSTSFVVILAVKRSKHDAFVFGTRVRHPEMNVLIGLLGGTMTVLPTRNFARFMLMAYLMYSLVIRSIYQGSFYHIAQTGGRLKEIQSISELIEENFKIYVYSANADTFKENAAIRNSVVLMSYDEVEENLEIIKTNPSFDVAIVKSLTSIKYHNQKVKSDERFKFCKETLITIPIVMYTRKSFFLIDALNEHFENFKAAGLMAKWYKEDINQDLLDEKIADVPKVFTIRDLLGCFQVWCFGLAISIVVFVIEVARKTGVISHL